MIVWGVVATATVDPWDLGAAMLTIWPAVLLSSLGGMMWKAKRWHMRPLSRANFFSSVQFLFGVSFALVIIWYVAWSIVCDTS